MLVFGLPRKTIMRIWARGPEGAFAVINYKSRFNRATANPDQLERGVLGFSK
jgi:hypothetical protein